MKKIHRAWRRGVCAGLIALGVLSSQTALAGIVYFDWDGNSAFNALETRTASLGEEVSGSVYVQLDSATDPIGLGNLVSWGVELTFDNPSIASYVSGSFAEAPAWDGFISCRDVSDNDCNGVLDPDSIRLAGDVDDFEAGVDAVDSPVKLFDISFTADALGSTNLLLTLFNAYLGVELDTSFDGNTYEEYDSFISFQDTSINVVTAVPVPAAAFLFIPGLLALAGIKKLNRS